MSLKLCADVKELLRDEIARHLKLAGERAGYHNSGEYGMCTRVYRDNTATEQEKLGAYHAREIAPLQAVLDDADFWHRTNMEPQILELKMYLVKGQVQRQYIFKNCAYKITSICTPEQQKLLIQDDFDSERRKFERLQHKFNLAQHTEPRSDRTGIPEEVRIAVWRRDDGRCV